MSRFDFKRRWNFETGSRLVTSDDLDKLRAEHSATYAGRSAFFRSAWRDTASAYQAPTPTPTLTLGVAGAAPTIAGTLRKPLNPDNTKAGVPFRYIGDRGNLAFGTSGVDVNYIRPSSYLAGSSNAYGPYSVRFGFAGATEFEIRFKQLSGSYFRLRVDDRWVAEGETAFGGTNGGQYYFKVSGLDAGPHVYQIDFNNGGWFGGIQAANTASLWKPQAPRIKAALLSDSVGGGAAGGSAGGSVDMSTWWERTCDLLGWGRWNLSEGGTGLTVNGTGTTFQNRLAPDVVPLAPDVLVIEGSRNDQDTPPATVRTAADSMYAAAKAALPKALIIVGGSWVSQTGNASYTNIMNVNAAQRGAALAAGLPFIDYANGKVYDAKGSVVIDGAPLVTGTGKYGTTTGDGTADWVTGADGTHPTRAGHDYKARWATEAVKAIVNALD